jgi:hypothetical protein
MMTKKIFFAALVSCVFTAGFLELTIGSKTTSVTPTSIEDTIAHPAHDTSEDVEGLKRDLAVLQTQLKRLAADRIDPSEATTEDQSTVDQEEPTETAPKPVQTEAEKTLFLAHQFELKYASQSDDPEWSEETENSIQDLFTNAAFAGADLVSVDCQTSICRLELNYESDDARDDFFAQAPNTAPLNSEGFFHLAEDGETTVLYVAREGHRLDG